MIKSIAVEEIPKDGRNCYVEEDIADFLASGAQQVEVSIPDGKIFRSVYASFWKAVSRKKYPIKVVQRGGRIFLLRKEEA